jgi:hypothetical protein
MVPGRVFASLLVLVLPHGVSAQWQVARLLGSLVILTALVACCGAGTHKAYQRGAAVLAGSLNLNILLSEGKETLLNF